MELRQCPSWSLNKSSSHKGPTLIQRGMWDKDADSLQFFGDHSTVVLGPDVGHVWVEPTPCYQTNREQISNWAKAANVVPSIISASWMSKARII